MRHFFTLLSHEAKMLLVNPSTYIAGVIFLELMGFIFMGILEDYSKVPQETSPTYVFFQLFWIPVLFMVPLLTMRSISEERRVGTMETLLTTPVTSGEVVLAKFGACYLLYLSMWAATAGFFYIVYRFSGDASFVDAGPMAGGYLFIAVSGLLFVAVGLFASSLSSNQAVAGILAFVFLFALIIGLRFVGGMDALKNDMLATTRDLVGQAQIFQHLEDFTRGVIDLRQMFFYTSGTALALILSVFGVEARQLHS